MIEFRGSNLSAEGIFRAKVGDNESDLPFRMSEERDGVRAAQMAVKEEDTDDATFCRTLPLEIVPSKLDSVDKKTYDAIFGTPNSEITFTIFNPDGQKAMKTVKMPPGEGPRPEEECSWTTFRKTAEAIVNVFETSKVRGRYGAVTVLKGRYRAPIVRPQPGLARQRVVVPAAEGLL